MGGITMTVLEIQQPRNLLELNEQEKRVVEQRLGVTVNQAVALLLAAREWAFENATPQNFEYRFPEFVAMYKLTPAMADVASTYVLDQTASDEEQEVDRRGFELLCSKQPGETWSEAEEQVWDAFMESAKKAAEQASASMNLIVKNVIERDMPTTKQEIENVLALAHLREWARAQIQ
jgi:hypothetical protein